MAMAGEQGSPSVRGMPGKHSARHSVGSGCALAGGAKTGLQVARPPTMRTRQVREARALQHVGASRKAQEG